MPDIINIRGIAQHYSLPVGEERERESAADDIIFIDPARTRH